MSLNFGGTGEDFADAADDSFLTTRRSGIENRSRRSIGLKAYYLWYSQRAAPVHGYLGAGPAVSWSRNHTDRNFTQSFTYVGQPEQTLAVVEGLTSRLWRVGIAGTAGVEWLVARRVGLFAENGTGLNYSSTKASRRSTITSPGQPKRTDDSDNDRHGWDFSGSGGRLGVSVYY